MGTGDDAYRLLWEFVGYGWGMSWFCYMAGWATSGKRLTSVVKIE